MELHETFDAVSPCVVALVSNLVAVPVGDSPLFPRILGTGFFVDRRGIVATNRHVIDALHNEPPAPDTGESSVKALLFFPVEDHGGGELRQPMGLIEIRQYFTLTTFDGGEAWYGQEIPDLGFIQLEAQDTPFLELADDDYYVRPGLRVATAGFPNGERCSSR